MAAPSPTEHDVADDRGQDALDHLQLAALEVIAALRAMLDVAEEAVREPQALRDVVAATARGATRAAGTAAGRVSTTEPPPARPPRRAASTGTPPAKKAAAKGTTKKAAASSDRTVPANGSASSEPPDPTPPFKAPAGGVEHISIT
jgi:hypothetical protein